MKDRLLPTERLLLIFTVILVFLGLLLRFWRIHQNEFIFYDEGLYLNYNQLFVQFMREKFPLNAADFAIALKLWYKVSLGSGKALWFFLIDARAFWGELEVWSYPRVVAAISGALTLGVTYLFASRFFDSKKVGLLSAGILAVLPSHIFYSRLGLQETTSTLFFLLGFYFYVFPRTFGKRIFFSAFMMVLAYFTNYRLIILPCLVAFTEIYLAVSEKRIPGFRKYLWHTLSFFFFVFLIGGLDQGQNTVVTFSWMFHQADLAQGHFDWINFFSYPYYFFRLESIVFGTLFFANIYFIWKREWSKLFPFFLICVQMGIFSLVEDKAARYICVILPFAVMMVGALIINLSEKWNKSSVIFFITILLAGSLTFKSVQLVQRRSNYEDAMNFLKAKNPDVKLLATQPWVLTLYASPKIKFSVYEAQHKFGSTFKAFANGYQYLVLCPQAYISFTKDGNKFSPQLEDFLEFTLTRIQPLKTFPHLNQALLDRFVFEHNENLTRSIHFLKENKEAGQIRIYDLRQIFSVVAAAGNQKKLGQ